MSERDAAQIAGGEVVTALHGVARALSLYEANNAAVVRQTGQLLDAVDHFLREQPQLEIQLREDEFFVNGRLLKVDPVLYERAADLASILGEFDVGVLSFEPGFDADTLARFTGDLTQSIRGGSSALQASYGALRLAKGQGSSMASLRLKPDRLAIWTFASLLDLTGRLYARHAAGEAPSLVPLRRALQLAIDGVREHSGLYQVLTGLRLGENAASLHLAMTIDAVGIGHGLRLKNKELMTLALGGLLGGLAPPDADGEAAIRPLFRYPGLGDAAVPLVLAVHDTREALAGRAAGLPGRILATVQRYHEALAGGGYAPQVLEALDAPAADLLRAFKGKVPVGTVLASDGQPAIVIGTQPLALMALDASGKPSGRITAGKLTPNRGVRPDLG